MNEKYVFEFDNFFGIGVNNSLDTVFDDDCRLFNLVTSFPHNGSWQVKRQLELKWKGVIAGFQIALELEGF